MIQLLCFLLIFTFGNSLRLFSSPFKNRINIEFFHGSKIDTLFYSTFLDKLQDSYDINVSTPNYITWPFFPKNTILIGHSFGGSICLWYCILEKLLGVSNIKACILINSHFNQREVMPYPKINISSIPVPVLTILTDNDEKLPIFKAIDDAIYVKQNNITNKEFIAITGNHTSCFTESYEMNLTIYHIKNFLFQIK